MSAIIWNNIVTNFQDVIEHSLTGINSLSSVTNHFVLSDIVDLNNAQPTSIINGQYTILLDSINSVKEDVGSGYEWFDYNVRLQFSFEFNINNSATDYKNAVNDLEEIIRKRLSVTSWYGSPVIENILFNTMSKHTWLKGVKSERFVLFEMIFRVIGQTNILS